MANANRLEKLIRLAGSVMGVDLESLLELSERRMLRKLFSILDNASHTLHVTLESYRKSTCTTPISEYFKYVH